MAQWGGRDGVGEGWGGQRGLGSAQPEQLGFFVSPQRQPDVSHFKASQGLWWWWGGGGGGGETRSRDLFTAATVLQKDPQRECKVEAVSDSSEPVVKRNT